MGRAMADKPLLSAAFLCEKVLQEKDDVLSAMRIVDTFTVSIPPDLPSGTKPAIQLTGLLSFKRASSGDRPEKHQATLRVRSPSGRQILLPQKIDLFFKAEECAGANAILNIGLSIEEFGLFWIDVFVDDEPTTQIPFRLLEAPRVPIH
jgi:hypothetical protein